MCVCVSVCVCMCMCDCVSAYVLERQFSLPHRGDVLHTTGKPDCKDHCQIGSTYVIET